MTETFIVKRGDTYALTCALSIDGVDQALDDATITSRVVSGAGRVMFACVVEKAPPADDGHVYAFTVTASSATTAAVPVGIYDSDIRYAWPDRVDSTPTFRVSIEPAPSQP